MFNRQQENCDYQLLRLLFWLNEGIDTDVAGGGQVEASDPVRALFAVILQRV